MSKPARTPEVISAIRTLHAAYMHANAAKRAAHERGDSASWYSYDAAEQRALRRFHRALDAHGIDLMEAHEIVKGAVES